MNMYSEHGWTKAKSSQTRIIFKGNGLEESDEEVYMKPKVGTRPLETLMVMLFEGKIILYLIKVGQHQAKECPQLTQGKEKETNNNKDNPVLKRLKKLKVDAAIWKFIATSQIHGQILINELSNIGLFSIGHIRRNGT